MTIQRFAFYGRVSTEDQQDPTSSKQWQMARATSIIEAHGGKVVREFFDIGQSRSLPWKRRPESLALLDAFKDPNRGFDAVVIGEPARAFYGNQFGLTFPVFVHYGVELWVPEVGGKVDPGSDAHDLVMSLYGGMSKGERSRIKIRVRSAMGAQALHEGRFLGGRPPYGYQLADAGAHPNPGKAAVGQRLHQLEPDPTSAPIVGRIFADYLSGRGIYSVAEGLTRDGVPSPSAHDPARNRHRDTRAWSKSAVRAILLNPRYTGREVWNRQRRDEVLLDVEDVAAGHQTKLRWNDSSDWIWSTDIKHVALVSSEDFAAVQAQMAVHAHRHTTKKSRAGRRCYSLSGILMCGACGRRMQGNWNHDLAHYRCRFPSEYALANKVDHPKTAYVKESAIVPELDRWLAELFNPKNVSATIGAMISAGDADEATEARADAARRKLADCDDRLGKYRAALDSGADPVVVSGWMSEVQADRLRAEADLASCVSHAPRSKADLRRMVLSLGNMAQVLSQAEPEDKADLYREFGITVIYDPLQRTVAAEVRPQDPCALERVGGGTAQLSDWRIQPWT
ncbi:MAG TPA: recombinase family protein [Acidimicrobiales bacterium]|jgi:DNA invertase Pin-like site-specific DNA recombinase|nr:recombinase family protein [Acidimicrobiales bacterium]